MKNLSKHLLIGLSIAGTLGAAWAVSPFGGPALQIGSDLNSIRNRFVQPRDPALSGGGRDQSLQFGDIMFGTPNLPNLLIGRLGIDVLLGGNKEDVIIGGTEHFNSKNRDRAFGLRDNDLFLWSPGDGSDFFDGGPGQDAVVFGLMGEIEDGQLVFRVSTDKEAGEVFVDPATGLPVMDVTNSPGFCEVIDSSSAANAQTKLDELGLDHLVRFFIRSVADDFEQGVQDTDNGLRVTLHLNDVEFLVCTNRNGGVIEAFDLTQTPPVPVPLNSIPIPALQSIVQ